MTTPTARSATPAAGVSTLQRTFVVASASLVAVFAASASPVPLFNLYRAENGVSTADLSLSVVAYFAGTILALLCLGRIANHVGRRPAALATLLVMVAGCIVLLNVTGLGTLLAGRFLMGIGAGLARSGGDLAGTHGGPDRRIGGRGCHGAVPTGSPVLGVPGHGPATDRLLAADAWQP